MFFPKRLAFSGGGTQCLTFLPTLSRLENQAQLTKVNEWWGTSAGALLASLLCITGSVEKVNSIFHQTDFTRFRDVNLMNLVEFKTSWGFDDGHSMVREVERILELAKTGSSQSKMCDLKGLHIAVCDLNIHKTIICSAQSYPDMRLVDVLRASMSLPFFYIPFRCPKTGHIWIDGGIDANLCWNFLPSDNARKEALGFAFERSWMQGPKTISEFIYSILFFGDPKYIRHRKMAWSKNIIWFQPPPFPAWYVRLKKDDFDLMEQLSFQGYQNWVTACSLKNSEFPVQSEDHHTPSSTSHLNCTNGMLDNLKCSSPPQLPYPSQDSQQKIQQFSRRWSV